MINSELFFQEAVKVVDKLRLSQMERIKEAGNLLAENLLGGGVVHIFGTGHSKAFSMELCHRAGGVIPMHRITLDDLALRGVVSSNDLANPELERDLNIAHKLWDLYRIEEKDAFIIASNSGRNGAIVEFARMVKERNMPLVVVTSMEHTTATTSRHPSGKKLYEFGDIVIDNCGPEGDALLEVEGLPMKGCSISSITGAFIAQGLTAEIIRNYKEKGVTPPVLISSNIDGGDEHNLRLKKLYEGRI